MRQSPSPPLLPEPQLVCPQCGVPVARTKADGVDASGHPQIEFTCPNHHRTIVVLIETEDEDVDLSTLPYNER